MVAFEPVERLVQVGEEGAVLRMTELVVIGTTATRARRSIVQLKHVLRSHRPRRRSAADPLRVDAPLCAVVAVLPGSRI